MKDLINTINDDEYFKFLNEIKKDIINTRKKVLLNANNELIMMYYRKTQNQIILNWIIRQKKLNVLIKTTNSNRINENINSLNFEMDMEDYNRLDLFRAEEFDKIVIDWEGKGGITVDQLANQFE